MAVLLRRVMIMVGVTVLSILYLHSYSSSIHLALHKRHMQTSLFMSALRSTKNNITKVPPNRKTASQVTKGKRNGLSNYRTADMKLKYTKSWRKTSGQYIVPQKQSKDSNTIQRHPQNNMKDFMNFLGKNSREWRQVKRSGVASFTSVLSKGEKRIFKDLMNEFNKIAINNNLTYFLYSGSLLGSYRHGNMIPWDDDIDVMMNFTEKPGIIEALTTSYPSYNLYDGPTMRWKFYSSMSRPIKNCPWPWPYIDISFFKENISHIWDADPKWKTKNCYDKSLVFPAMEQLFLGSRYPVPRYSVQVLKQSYNISICQTLSFNHKTEEVILYPPPLQVPCAQLANYIPFATTAK